MRRFILIFGLIFYIHHQQSIANTCLTPDGKLCRTQLADNLKNLEAIRNTIKNISTAEELVKVFLDRPGYSYKYSARDDRLIYKLYEYLANAKSSNRDLTQYEIEQVKGLLIDIEEAHRKREKLPPLVEGMNPTEIVDRSEAATEALTQSINIKPQTPKPKTSEVAKPNSNTPLQVASPHTVNSTAAEMVSEVPDSAAYWKNVPQVVNYSTHPKVKKMLIAAEEDAVAPRNCDKCYRFVKYALCYPDSPKRANCSRSPNLSGACTKNAIVSSYPEGVLARSAVRILSQPNHGFINLLDGAHAKHIRESYDNIPKGAILVYQRKDQPNEPGHIEIKSDWGSNSRYLHFLNSDHSIADNKLAPSASSRYELIGVMIKPIIQ